MLTRQRAFLTAAPLVVALAASAVACGGDGQGSSPTSGRQRLRVVNVGPDSIESLTVLFPKDQIGFGAVQAGTTTPYRDAANGVYSYAAYQFRLAGSEAVQPVIDWVGESPLVGRAFTYTIEVDRNAPNFQRIRLRSVDRDQ